MWDKRNIWILQSVTPKNSFCATKHSAHKNSLFSSPFKCPLQRALAAIEKPADLSFLGHLAIPSGHSRILCLKNYCKWNRFWRQSNNNVRSSIDPWPMKKFMSRINNFSFVIWCVQITPHFYMFYLVIPIYKKNSEDRIILIHRISSGSWSESSLQLTQFCQALLLQKRRWI